MIDSTDREMLRTLLSSDHQDSLTEWEKEAFSDMLEGLQEGGHERLSERQREIVKAVHARLIPEYENLVSSGKVPRGREVPDPPAFSYRPLKPPHRRSES